MATVAPNPSVSTAGRVGRASLEGTGVRVTGPILADRLPRPKRKGCGVLPHRGLRAALVSSAGMQAAQVADVSTGGVAARARAYMELSKARLSALVVVTTAVGFLLGESGPLRVGLFVWT